MIKMCKENRKPILIIGGAIYSLMYLSACDFKILDLIKTNGVNIENIFKMDTVKFYQKFIQSDVFSSKKFN